MRRSAPTEVAEGIRATVDNEYAVTRAALTRLLADDAGTLARSARIVPHYREGAARGFKLYAVRRSSTLAHLGLRNGDTVLRIGGREMTDPERALSAYQAMRDAESLTVDIERRGREVQLQYRVVESLPPAED